MFGNVNYTFIGHVGPERTANTVIKRPPTLSGVDERIILVTDPEKNPSLTEEILRIRRCIYDSSEMLSNGGVKTSE